MRYFPPPSSGSWRGWRRADWRRKREEGNPFVMKVSAQSKLSLIGSEADLG